MHHQTVSEPALGLPHDYHTPSADYYDLAGDHQPYHGYYGASPHHDLPVHFSKFPHHATWDGKTGHHSADVNEITPETAQQAGATIAQFLGGLGINIDTKTPEGTAKNFVTDAMIPAGDEGVCVRSFLEGMGIPVHHDPRLDGLVSMREVGGSEHAGRSLADLFHGMGIEFSYDHPVQLPEGQAGHDIQAFMTGLGIHHPTGDVLPAPHHSHFNAASA